MNAIKKIEKFEKFGSVLGLERIRKLMELLGNPEKKLKLIHIAGTNGKGSVSRYIYEGLRANGYRMGLFTSPFLQIFNERIEFDVEYVTYYTEREITMVGGHQSVNAKGALIAIELMRKIRKINVERSEL